MIRAFPLLLLPLALVLRYIVGIFLLGGFPAKGVSWSDAGAKWHHPMKNVDDNLLYMVGTSDQTHFEDFNSTLDSILIPRVPGTEGHEIVRQYILGEMNALGWNVEQDVFSSRTPYGRKDFANIIATHDPKACRHLVIACHYDSLSNREFTFLGATDSAVPCAMMINAARLLHPVLKKSLAEDKEVTLQFIFFDGEEAFKKWSSSDSLYGSRHLAEKWNTKTPFSNSEPCGDRDYASYLDRMDVMVLLDLIGTADPKFYSYFLDTFNLYMNFANAERHLNQLKLLEVPEPEANTNYFQSRNTLAFVEDDHVPFMRKGVPIVHLIPSPFPHVWHKESDNRQSLHHPTINNLNKILRVFIVQYLNLDTPDSILKL